jgi:putative phosphoesterase
MQLSSKMKIGLISDTHRNIVNLDKAIKKLKEIGVDKIIHLGDNYTDIDEIGETEILRVPGVFSESYQDPEIPNRIVCFFSGWRVLISHTISSHPNDLKNDLKPEEYIQGKKIDVVLYGHTHIPDIKKENVIYVNPGHLKDEDKKGYPPTFALLELTETDITVKIYDLKTGKIYREELFQRRD